MSIWCVNVCSNLKEMSSNALFMWAKQYHKQQKLLQLCFLLRSFNGFLVCISLSSKTNVQLKLRRERMRKRWVREMVWLEEGKLSLHPCLCVHLHKELQSVGILLEAAWGRTQMMRSGRGHWPSFFILLGWSWASRRPHEPLNCILKRGQ